MTQEPDVPRAAGLEAARRRVREILAEGQFVDHLGSRRLHEFAVWDATAQRFRCPAFQYTDDGQVRPEMEDLLKLLPADRSGWRGAFWLYQPHARLSGTSPVDVFANDPAAVIAAARSTFDPGETNW